MTDQVKDQISALLDDELDARESGLLLVRLGKDSELTAVWERYNLIGDCIRGSLPDRIIPGFADRVAEAIGRNEAAEQVVHASRSKRWRPAAGLAVAASVAMVALIALNSPRSPNPEFAAPPNLSAAQESYTVPVINMREQASAALRERLNLYQVSHSEFAGPMQRRSLISQIARDDVAEDLTDVDDGSGVRE